MRRRGARKGGRDGRGHRLRAHAAKRSRRRPEPRAPDAGSPSRSRGDSPSAHASAAHPRIRWGMSASVYSLRAISEGAPAVGASAADDRDFVHLDVCHGLLDRAAPGEDLAAAALAGVGSFVGECLDLSGDEPYSFHGREILSWGAVISQSYQDFPPTVSGTVTPRSPRKVELSDRVAALALSHEGLAGAVLRLWERGRPARNAALARGDTLILAFSHKGLTGVGFEFRLSSECRTA